MVEKERYIAGMLCAYFDWWRQIATMADCVLTNERPAMGRDPRTRHMAL